MSRVKDNLRKGQGNLKINGLVEQYRVSSSENISAGDFIKFIEPDSESISINKLRSGEVEINDNGIYNGEYQIQKFVYDSTIVDSIVNTDEIVSIPLDEKSAFIVYRDPDNNMAGTAFIATMVDNNIEYSGKYIFNSNSISNITAALIDTNRVLVVFTNQSNNNYGTATILQIVDNCIELKDSVVFNAGSTLYSKAVRLTKGEILIVFADNDNNRSGASILVNIDDNNCITLSNKVAFSVESINYMDITALTENKVLVVYSSENTYNGNANVLEINYNSIDVGPNYTLNLDLTEDEQDIAFISTATIDSSNAVIGYRKTLIDGHDHDYYAIVVANVIGTEVKLGSKKVLNTDACNLPITVNVMADNNVVAIYESFYNDTYYLNLSVIDMDPNNVIQDNIYTTAISNRLISSTLCTINLTKYNCISFVKSEINKDTNNFECYNIEMVPTKSYNVYNGNIEDTDVFHSKSISGDFGDINTIVVDDTTIVVPYVQQKDWDIEGKQILSDGICYLVHTNDKSKPLSQWNESSVTFETDMNIVNINGLLLRENKVILVYTDVDNTVCKYTILNINKDSDDNSKLVIIDKGIFSESDIYIGNNSLVRLDDNRVILIYRLEEDYSIRAKIMVITDSVSFGDEYILLEGSSPTTIMPVNISAVSIDNNRVYVSYTLGKDTNVVEGKLLDINENTGIDNIYHRNFTIDKATNIYENKLMCLEPNTVIQSSEIVVEEGTVSNTYDITAEDINITSLKAGAVINCPYTGSSKEVELPAGKYKLECWGAQGGYGDNIKTAEGLQCAGGLGGYSTGVVTLTETTKLYLYSGGQGRYIPINDETDEIIASGGGFNGGGPGRVARDKDNNLVGGASGGGGTDIRIGLDSLYARVIVAGGGSGLSHDVLTSYNDDNEISLVLVENYNGRYCGDESNLSGHQNKAGYNPEYLDGNGLFGKASSYIYSKEFSGQTGAGGGWYSGANTISPSHAYASYEELEIIRPGSGSGYVYNENNTSNYPTGCLLSSNYYLEEAQIVDGSLTTSFSDPETGESVNGRSGNGYIRITVLESDYEDEHPSTIGNTTILQFNGENISVHDSAIIAPADTARINNIDILKVDKDLNRTLLFATYNHVTKYSSISNPLVTPGSVSLNHDLNGKYQMSFIGTNESFKHDDSYNTLYSSSALLDKDMIVTARTNRSIDDDKQDHASTLELQTFKIQNNGIVDDLEKFDVIDINKKYITNNSNGAIEYLSFNGIKIDDNRILAISSIKNKNSYSGICEVYNISSDRQEITLKSEQITFCTARVSNLNVAKIDTNKVIITFNTSTNTSAGVCYAIVGVVNDDNTVTFGELLEFSEIDYYTSNIIVLSKNRVLVSISNTLKVLYAESDNSLTILANNIIDNDGEGIGGLEEINYCPKSIVQLNETKLLMTYAITDISYCAIITIDDVNNISIGDREVFVNYDTIVQNGNNSINSILIDDNKVLIEYMTGIDTISIHSSIVTISKDSINVGSRTILVEDIDPKQYLNLYKINNSVLFTYINSTDSDYSINYSLLEVSDNNIINIRNIYTFDGIYTTVPFTNTTLMDDNTLLLYTKVSDNNNIICNIVCNLIKDISKYTKGHVLYSNTLRQNSLTPIMDYRLLTDDINEIAESVDIVKLSDDKLLITYIDSFTKYGVAKIANISNQSIEFGEKYTIYDSAITNVKSKVMSDGRIFMVITDTFDDYRAKYIIASIDENDEISFTNPIQRSSIEHTMGNDLDIIVLPNNRIFIAYQDGSFEIVNVENDEITLIYIDIFDEDCEFSDIIANKVTDNKVILLYKSAISVEDSNLYSIKSMVIDILSDNISKVSDIQTIYQSGEEFDGSMSLIEVDQYKHRYLLSINSIGYLIVLTASEKVLINPDLSLSFNNTILSASLIRVEENKCLVLYSDGFGAIGLLVEIDGLEITKINEFKFDNGVINSINATYLSDSKIFTILNENVYGNNITSASTLLFNIDKNVVIKYDGIDKPNGIAKNDGIINGVIDVYITGNIQQ